MKYYLLDYENVNSSGLEGISELPSDSRIVLFYTRNSSKIDLGSVNLLRSMKGELTIIEVHHGKQALDIQLASYLGYLIGTEPKDTEYYIISKDKGYRNVQSFWPDRRIVLCRNLQPDSEIIDEPAEVKKPAAKASRSTKSSGKAKAKAKPAPVEEPAETAEELKPNAFAEAAAIAKAVVEAKKARNEAEKKAEAAPAEKPAKKTKKTSAKKAVAKKTAAKKKTTDRNEVNNEIQKILSKEGFPEDVVNATASLVAKNYGKDGYKQTIYRTIIKENGQKQGLAVYRLIKDKL